jgi:hypothetical protein
MKHTPPPWTVTQTRYGGGIVTGPDGKRIARCGKLSNAELIARAPLMLLALRPVIDEIEGKRPGDVVVTLKLTAEECSAVLESVRGLL